MTPIFVFLIVAFAATEAKIYDYTSVCDVNDPGLNECVKNAAQDAMKSLSNKGSKEFGIPKINPLKVPSMVISQGNGPVGLTLTLKNSDHYGLSEIIFNSAKADPKNYHMEFDVTFPYYGIVGDYKGEGRILLLPIYGEGPSNLTFYDIQGKWILDGKPMTKNGETYMNLTSFDVNVLSNKGTFYLGNLFNGNSQLADTMSRFLNENSGEVFKEMKPALDGSFSALYHGLSKRLFDKVPYKQLFKGV